MAGFTTFLRGGLTAGLFCALIAGRAQAGILEMDLTVGANTIQILQGGFYDTGGNPDTITVNTSALNATLAGLGDGNLTFSDLSANTNNPGDPTGATLIQTGTALVSSGTVAFSIVAFQTDFVVPSGNVGTLSSSAGGTFTKTSTGDSTAFTSYYDPTNTGALTVPSPTLTYPAPNTNGNSGYGSSAPDTMVGSVVPGYALVNQIQVSLTGSSSKIGKDQFTGSTVLFATAVPEPSSVLMLISALPVGLGLARRFRRGMKVVD